MKRFLGITTTSIILLSVLGAPSASAYASGDASCLVISSNVITNGTDCVGSIVVPAGVTSIANLAFVNSAVTSLTLPAGFRTIGQQAFLYSSLNSINLPNTVTSIGNSAFVFGLLTTITIPSSVTSIADSAFIFGSLRSITFEGSATTLGSGAFYGNGALATVRFLGNAPSSVGGSAFVNAAPSAKAVVNASATGFPAAGQLWNGLIIEIFNDEPSAEQLAANAREAARIAEAARQAAKRQARAELTEGSQKFLTLENFASAEIVCATSTNLSQVSAEISALTAEFRGDINKIIKICRKYVIVGKIASGARTYPRELQEAELIASDSAYKTVLTLAVLKKPADERSNFEKIQSIINAEMAKIQVRKDQLQRLKARRPQ
jgi:hypothetical protein